GEQHRYFVVAQEVARAPRNYARAGTARGVARGGCARAGQTRDRNPARLNTVRRIRELGIVARWIHPLHAEAKVEVREKLGPRPCPSWCLHAEENVSGATQKVDVAVKKRFGPGRYHLLQIRIRVSEVRSNTNPR